MVQSSFVGTLTKRLAMPLRNEFLRFTRQLPLQSFETPMPVTKLDPRTALIVIDLQKGIVGMPTAHSTADIVSRASELATAFRKHGLPVVLVNVDAGAPGRTEQSRNFPRSDDWAVLVPELNQQLSDITVTKKTWGAFSSTDLDAQLKKLGVTQVVLAGVATSAGVESSARHAHELGYNVTLATDAMTDMSADAHSNSISRIFPRIGETGTSREIIELLDAQAAHSRSQ
jgi:nicotinamidase-related amidase